MNRLTTTTLNNVSTGQFGTTFDTTVGAVSTTNVYDAAGNIVQQIDGRGNSVFTFYNKTGQKIAQVDQEGYLTAYDRDADGNVLTETRYATRLSTSILTASDPAALRTNAGSTSDDRITSFTYDRNGRRLTETRSGVVASTVSATGVLSTSTQSATVSYP